MADDRARDERRETAPQVPLGQRLLDNPWLLLAAGIAVMFVFFTGWGLWEIYSLTPAPLP